MPSVVVVGTSLGGLAALTRLLEALPSDFAVPLAIVQHRGKTEDDALVRLLAAQTALGVCEPNDKDALEPGRVYLAPADYHLLVEPTSIALSTAPARNFARPSIDFLFESAADSHGAGALAVLLTGSNDDGAYGCRHIKQRGGRVFVEDPATAHSSAMPASAIAATQVDVVLPLPQLCQRIIEACK
ncbi:MAG TPA: chemotaxis protein CheB [Polyangiaceae bacterium]|nr:chemotaxis protein CheB [Polyangiaceae bacterium]